MFKRIVICVVLSMASLVSQAQIEGALSSYSPYTMFGIGVLSVGGNAASRAMGGVGIAARDKYEFNYLNPASLSAIPQRTAIFNFAGMNANYYQAYNNNKNAYNGTTLHDLGFAIPLGKGIGMGVSLTPLSSVGYSTMVVNDNADIIGNIGRAIYSYWGQGGISQLSTSIGAQLFTGFSVGATMHYQFGSIDREWKSQIFSFIEDEDYRSIRTLETTQVDQLQFSFGAQYQVRVGSDDNLTIGATYNLAKQGEFDRKQLSYTEGSMFKDTVAFGQTVFPATMPEKIAGGIYFSNPKLGVGLDYSYQNWAGAFDMPEGMTLGEIHDYRFGMKYTHDRQSLRSFFHRITYKAGARYSTSYLIRDGHQPTTWAVSAGFDMPLKSRNFSALNIGVEYGERGARGAILKESFFNVVFGLSLFGGDDMWFVKRKFN